MNDVHNRLTIDRKQKKITEDDRGDTTAPPLSDVKYVLAFDIEALLWRSGFFMQVFFYDTAFVNIFVTQIDGCFPAQESQNNKIKTLEFLSQYRSIVTLDIVL